MFHFCCAQCGDGGVCSHKRKQALSILLLPEQQEVQNELLNLPKKDREDVWADMIANPNITHYKNPKEVLEKEKPEFLDQVMKDLQKELNKSISSNEVSDDSDSSGDEGTSSGNSNSNNRGHSSNNSHKKRSAGGWFGSRVAGAAAAAMFNKPRNAYEYVYKTNPEYVTSQDFQLRFLRADKYNPIAASKRILTHFDVKEELFGRDKLGRDITYDDLSDDEKHIFDSGKNRFLRHTDSAGRTVFVTRPGKVNYSKPTNELRAGWVLVNGKDSPLTLNRNNCQTLGFVHIAYVLDGYPSQLNYELFRCGAKMLLGTPMRFVSMYIVESSKGVGWKSVIDFFTYVMGNVMRVRTRTISGTKQEVMYNLMCLGFSPRNIPIEIQRDDEDDNDGNCDTQLDVKYSGSLRIADIGIKNNSNGDTSNFVMNNNHLVHNTNNIGNHLIEDEESDDDNFDDHGNNKKSDTSPPSVRRASGATDDDDSLSSRSSTAETEEDDEELEPESPSSSGEYRNQFHNKRQRIVMTINTSSDEE